MRLFLAALAIVGASVLLPGRVDHGAQAVRLGYPIPFVVQEIGLYRAYGEDGVPPAPDWHGLFSPWENPLSVRPLAFVIDVAMLLALLAVVTKAKAVRAVAAR